MALVGIVKFLAKLIGIKAERFLEIVTKIRTKPIFMGETMKKTALGGIRTLNPLRATHFKCVSYTSSDTRA